MASNNQQSLSNPKFPLVINKTEEQQPNLELESNKGDEFDYSKRAQWLRAAVLTANDGLVSTASLMMGVGAVKQDVKDMILIGVVGLVAGACSMAIGEYVSVYSQLDIELAQMKREKENGGEGRNFEERDKELVQVKREKEKGEAGNVEQREEEEEKLLNPFKAAAASALAFSVGATVPLLAASFIRNYKLRLCVTVGTVGLALVVLGWLGAVLGKAPVVRSSIRILIGGLLAMATTFGLSKLVPSSDS